MSEKCYLIHKWFNSLKRFNFSFNEDEVPKNGVYILFEKGEKSHRLDRIVRVGTHTGQDQLVSRIRQHFINENKDRSIFRKNIGRALLNKEQDKFIHLWEIDLTTKASKERNKDKINLVKQREVEEKVTRYIKEKFSFAIFEVKEKEERLKIESRIISTISWCKECKPSDNWLGLSSTKEKIRKSGLWIVNELYKEPLDKSSLETLKELLKIG